jgi:hypothetical protein
VHLNNDPPSIFTIRSPSIIVSNQVLALVEHGVLLPLLRMVSDNDNEDDNNVNTSSSNSLDCALNALRAILYLTSSVEQVTQTCVEELLQLKAVGRLVELVLSTKIYNAKSAAGAAKLVNLALAILANLTRTEVGAVALVGKTLPDHAVLKKEDDDSQNKQPKQRPTLLLLMDRYLNRDYMGTPSTPYNELEPHEWDTLYHDPYQHFAAILMNITQLESGRAFVMKLGGEQQQPQQPRPQKEQKTPSLPGASAKQPPGPKSVLETLLPQMAGASSSKNNPIRRRGISGMIRNCCLDKEAAWWMLNMAKILTPLLSPLAGPEELDWDEKQGMDPDLWLQGPDKVRDIDVATRQHCVEALLLLCASGRQSRKAIRLGRTYVILKYADMVEESETVSERINECVQYLRRDEEGTEEGSSDKFVEDFAGGGGTNHASTSTSTQLKLLPSSQISGSADYDDVD